MASNIRFLITDWSHIWDGDTLFIVAHTDICCTLTMHWTYTPPRTHLKVYEVRGLRKMADPKKCFVDTAQMLQSEAEECTFHSFKLELPSPVPTVYFYFTATVAGVPSPSNTAIFTMTPYKQEPAPTLRHTDLIDKEVAGVINHGTYSVIGPKLASNIDAADKNFHTQWVNSLRFRPILEYSIFGFGPGRFIFSSRALSPEIVSTLALWGSGPPADEESGLLIPVWRRIGTYDHNPGLYNAGAEEISYVTCSYYEMQPKP